MVRFASLSLQASNLDIADQLASIIVWETKGESGQPVKPKLVFVTIPLMDTTTKWKWAPS